MNRWLALLCPLDSARRLGFDGPMWSLRKPGYDPETMRAVVVAYRRERQAGRLAMNGQFALTSVISLVLLVLSGCASPEELRARDEAVCAGYGFVKGTTDFARCLQQESLARQYYFYDYAYGSGYWGRF